MSLFAVLSIAKVMLVSHATWCPASGSAAGIGLDLWSIAWLNPCSIVDAGGWLRCVCCAQVGHVSSTVTVSSTVDTVDGCVWMGVYVLTDPVAMCAHRLSHRLGGNLVVVPVLSGTGIHAAVARRVSLYLDGWW